REAALRGPAAEVVEGTEGHVLLVGGGPRCPLEFGAGQRHQPLVIPLPKRPRRRLITPLEPGPPAGARALRTPASPLLLKRQIPVRPARSFGKCQDDSNAPIRAPPTAFPRGNLLGACPDAGESRVPSGTCNG